MNLSQVDPSAALTLMQQGALLFDVREPDERAREFIPGSHSLPLSKLQSLPPYARGKTVIFHCASGNRTHVHSARLEAAAPGALVLSGGLNAWKLAGAPTVRDARRPIELMRQVQIAAGSLVVAGAVLAWAVSPWFMALSAFVGMGLVVAGVTGFCGMARLLARLPWNQVPSTPTASV